MNIFLKWHQREISNKHRLLVLTISALIFPITIPILLVVVFPRLDQYFGIGPLFFGWGNLLIGVLAVVVGGSVALWTVVIQVMLASGTPLPMLPTKKLLTVGPFKYCRNPMTLGTIIAYSGIAIWIGSWSALLAVVVFAVVLIAYLKIVEEKELLLRFGSEYLEYKKKTPFILPIGIRKSDSRTTDP